MLHVLKSKFAYFFLLLLGVIVFTSCQDDIQKSIDEQKALDEAEIQAYLTENNITNAQRQASGLYYVPKTAGTGNKIQKGNTVRIHYIGKYYNGVKFDSSYDTGQPLLINKVGSGEVIKGWDEGLQLMQLNETATLIVPSYLGYSDRLIRIFDINVLEVK
ncbi:MAG: hypothetical protein COW65_16670 [Cytophagales bacterium CG18_big_fil_WC_8_21_14_2_50_42_9]|nr:MAG: hypothetical protein COW65_16670 [Cytophagales bacterium CG18_big_fil_WC_8_21_14_2_50_42_9]